MSTKAFFILSISCAFLWGCQKEAKLPLRTDLENIFPNSTIKAIKISNTALYEQAYEIVLPQLLDHQRPEAGTFQQVIHLLHVGFEQPVVLETEGYELYHLQTHKPLSQLLKANQIIVEHRFMGKSIPNKSSSNKNIWKYLTVEQVAADHHRIVELLKPLYTGKWLNAGFSKGGQTALFHRRFYPDDVVATVAFDAPLPLAQQDQRLYDFFDTIGTAACRQKIIDFQRMLLEKRTVLLPSFKTKMAKEKLTFGQSSLEEGYELGVLEYPFSFWQYGNVTCDAIPTKAATEDAIFEHFMKVVAFGWLSDRAYGNAAMYQFHTQLGYYGYVTKHVKDLLKIVPLEANNVQFAPNAATLTFDPKPSSELQQWIQNEGKRILLIYGGKDPWASVRVELKNDQTDVVLKVSPEGNHATFIQDFPKEEQEEMLEILRGWLGD